MCGRFTQRFSWRELVELYQEFLDQPAQNLPARFNVLPGTDVFVARPPRESTGETGGEASREAGGKPVWQAANMRWGYRPHWRDKHPFPINARAETLFESRMWQPDVKSRRCVVPMDGFYEPIGPKKPKRPQMFFRLPDDRPFMIAGIWTHWPGDDTTDAMDTFAIVTVPANEQVGAVHERMPAILTPEDCALWLDPDFYDPPALAALLRPGDGEPLDGWGVGRTVNARGAEGPDCIAPADTEPPLL